MVPHLPLLVCYYINSSIHSKAKFWIIFCFANVFFLPADFPWKHKFRWDCSPQALTLHKNTVSAVLAGGLESRGMDGPKSGGLWLFIQ